MNSPNKQQEIISKIKQGKYTEAELIALKNNATKLGYHDVAEAAELQMRKQFPKAATKLFGARGDVAKIKLEETYSALATLFDFSQNKSRNGVKLGGEQRTGRSYIDYYISYKNKDGYGVYLQLFQETVDAELKAIVKHYKSGDGKSEDGHIFGMSDYPQAVDLYKEHLSKVIL